MLNEKAKPTVIILLGPKGSGKSYIGKLIEKHLHIHFLAVEPIFLELKGNRKPTDESYIRDGFQALEETIRDCLENKEHVIIEQTGAADYFLQFLDNLKSQFQVKVIRIHAPEETCFRRIEQRDSKNQVPVSRELIEIINRKSVSLELDVVLRIDNSKSTDAEIIEAFKTIL